jgi:hypothetical protein
MPRPNFTVQPQRSDGRGWVPCELHRATSFAVIRTDTFTRKGKPFTASRVLSRCTTKFQAEGLAEANRKAFAPVPRDQVRKLGRRIISK